MGGGRDKRNVPVFRCTAQDCEITCCQEWKITNDDGSIIQLDEHGKCPHLTKDGLCQLVIDHGDGVLSETCAQFPRQIHEFLNRTELSYVLCCPEVVNIINKMDAFSLNLEELSFDERKLLEKDSLFALRNFLMELISSKEYTIEVALKMAMYILQDVKNEGDFKRGNYGEDSLLELQQVIASIDIDFLDSFEEDNEIFLDLAENYRKQGIYADFLTPRAKLAEAFEEEFDEQQLKSDYEKFLVEYQEYEDLLRKCVVSNVFSDVLLGESDITNMIVAFQWLGMEYVAMRHVLFLDYLRDGKLVYSIVKEDIVYISRMTGYDEEDIVEYLDNCFEDLEWEWGYFALLIG